MSEGWVYGVHAVARRLASAPADCIEFYCLESPNRRLAELQAKARSAGLRLQTLSRDELTRLVGSDRHQGCALLTREPDAPAMDLDACIAKIQPDSLLLVLDGVQDPHNLGACLRSADACGVDAVIIPRDRAVGVNATVRKVAAGAADSVAVIEVTNLARSLAQLQRAGVWLYGAAGEADRSIYECDFSGPVALVMGAEAGGLRRLTRDACDVLFHLPMRGRVESLNVSVATGICLYEIRRARASRQ
ncbi:MAG: 23S rRNA (guanosine(2251)-2'-O)-methyltransferase RlmB [Gammaproteobacteria bacterium]|nr:23S rRNA (guanosine(2251)-2'-O)-methyltransferase RlmB [Gammaproteobacteria bacterium]